MPLNEPYDWESPEQFEERQREQLMVPMPQEERELLELISLQTPDNAAAPPSDYGNVPTAREELPQEAFVQPGYEYGQTIEGMPGSPPAPPAPMDLATTTRAGAQADIAASYGIGREAIPQGLLPQDPGGYIGEEDQPVETIGGEYIPVPPPGPPVRRLEPPAPTSTQDAELQRAEKAAAPSAPAAPGTREQRRQQYATGIAKTGHARAELLVDKATNLRAQGREEEAAQLFSNARKWKAQAALEDAQKDATTRARAFHAKRTKELADLHQKKADSNYFKKSSTGGKISMILMGMMGGWLQTFRKDGKNIGLEYLNKMIERWADEEQENYQRQKGSLEDKRNMFIDAERIEDREINYKHNAIIRMETALKTEMDQIGRKYGHLEKSANIKDVALQLGEQTAAKLEGLRADDEKWAYDRAQDKADLEVKRFVAKTGRKSLGIGYGRLKLDRDKFEADEGRRAWDALTEFSATGQPDPSRAVPFMAGKQGEIKGHFKPKTVISPEQVGKINGRQRYTNEVRRKGLRLLTLMQSGGRIYDGPLSEYIEESRSGEIRQLLLDLRTQKGVQAFGTTTTKEQDLRLKKIVGDIDTFMQTNADKNYKLIRNFVIEVGEGQYDDDRQWLEAGFKDVRPGFKAPSVKALEGEEYSDWKTAQADELSGYLKTYEEAGAKKRDSWLGGRGVGAIREGLLPSEAPTGPAPKLAKEAPAAAKKLVDNAIRISKKKGSTAEDKWSALEIALDRAYRVYQGTPPPKGEKPGEIKDVARRRHTNQLKRSLNARQQYFKIRKLTSNFLAATGERDLNITVDGKKFATNAEADNALSKQYPPVVHEGISKGTAKKYDEGFKATEKAVAKVGKGQRGKIRWRLPWSQLSQAEKTSEHRRVNPRWNFKMPLRKLMKEPEERKQYRISRQTREQ